MVENLNEAKLAESVNFSRKVKEKFSLFKGMATLDYEEFIEQHKAMCELVKEFNLEVREEDCSGRQTYQENDKSKMINQTSSSLLLLPPLEADDALN